MNTKLTLKLDQQVIRKAKNYAAQKDQSLSDLVENYFRSLSLPVDSERLGSVVKELSGVIKLGPQEDLADEYASYLLKKYR